MTTKLSEITRMAAHSNEAYVHVDWANLASDRDGVMLIGVLTGNFNCKPIEVEGADNSDSMRLFFRDEFGIGYQLDYDIKGTECNTAYISNVSVQRNAYFDDQNYTMPASKLFSRVEWAVVCIDAISYEIWSVEYCGQRDSAVEKAHELSDNGPDEEFIYRVVHIINE